MKPEPIDPDEFAALQLIAVEIGRMSEVRVDAARSVIQEGKTYRFVADQLNVSAQAVWNTVARLEALLAVYRQAKALETAGRRGAQKTGTPKRHAGTR